ncbi:MAG: metallophosphoesterase [Verrucomicrobia bacterium]|nr:metallophosphoesterase [Verrucomicrobiota bacterium]MBU1735130.1 metallophosphoesterase [Verrucomicrobiota bacterium]MBU1855987.1 metallophosphoesterase [Verrucomicrobiota bacterium]
MSAFTFAVIGDYHWVNRSCHNHAIARGVTEDLDKYEWMHRHVTPALIKAVCRHRPRFLFQLGDLAEGSCDSVGKEKLELAEAWKNLAKTGAPVFTVHGNHNPSALYCQTVRSAMSRSLHCPINTAHFHFQYERVHFIGLDTSDLRINNPQYKWLQSLLEQAAQWNERVFLFGHFPLFLVGRPCFSDLAFMRALGALTAKYLVDAYFCGHTHNQSVTLHTRDGRSILQAKGFALGYSDKPPLALEVARRVLIGPRDRYLGGFLEDYAPGYFLVKVWKNRVVLSWRVLNMGEVVRVEWRRAGHYQVRQVLPLARMAAMRSQDWKQIKSARLHMASFGLKQEDCPVALNGAPIGLAKSGLSFAPRRCIAIPADQARLIRTVNTVAIATPKRAGIFIGGVRLELTLQDGRTVSSPVSDFYATARRWDAWRTPHVHHVRRGRNIVIKLSFTG